MGDDLRRRNAIPNEILLRYLSYVDQNLRIGRKDEDEESIVVGNIKKFLLFEKLIFLYMCAVRR